MRLSKEEELEATGTDFQWTEVPETPMKDEKSRRKRNVFRSVPETPRKDRHSRKRTVRQASGCNSDYDEEDPDDDFHGTPEPSSDPVEEDITDFTGYPFRIIGDIYDLIYLLPSPFFRRNACGMSSVPETSEVRYYQCSYRQWLPIDVF